MHSSWFANIAWPVRARCQIRLRRNCSVRTKPERLLVEFEPTAISILSEARFECRGDPDFHQSLVELCTDSRPNFADGASWMLKAELEDGHSLEVFLVEWLAVKLNCIPTWAAKLHICQSVGMLELDRAQAIRFKDWALTLTQSERPFLRAWSIDALFQCGIQHQDLEAFARETINDGVNDGAPSERARARKLQKLLSSS